MSRRISDYERLLQETLRRAERAEELQQQERRAREQAEQQQQQERQAREQAEQQQQQERRAREQAEQRQRKTTLDEYLEACHGLSRSIRIETDATLTTQGDVTNPYNRKYPKRIIPWDTSQRQDLFFQEGDSQTKEMDFPDLQKEVWERLSRDPTFLSQELFPSWNDLEYVKSTIETISDEMGVRYYERDTVENMVRFVLEEVYKNEVLRKEFQLQGDVKFGSHLNLGREERSMEDAMREVTIDEPSTPGPRKASTKASKKAQVEAKSKSRGGRRADQFCIYHRKDQADSPTLAIEYKAPHKLSRNDIVTGLREIEPDRDVIGQEGDDFSFHSMRLITAVMTQLFSYMIGIGVQYGYICTGEALIFLKIADDPSTVYYYLSIPNEDMEQVNDRHRTAVAQVLAFTLHSLAAKPPPQSWHDAADKLEVWNVEYDDVLRNIPPTVRKERTPTPYKPGRWKSVKRSRVKTRSQCRTAADQMGSEDDSSPPTPSPSDRRDAEHTKGKKGKKRDEKKSGTESGAKSGTKSIEKPTSRQYCTQQCLRGLFTRGALDNDCPNVDEHRGTVRGQDMHLIRSSTFLRLMRSQLARDRDSNCEPLYIQGARGALFKLTLASHGYTVAAKGTISAFIPDLQHEATIYRQLCSIQGVHVPVCLGAVDLVRPYYHNGSKIVHMLFLSWGGIRIDRHIDRNNMDEVLDRATSALQAIHQLGVLHHDAMPRNLLWNAQAKRVLVVDFERSKVVERKRMKKRTALGAISGNPRSQKKRKTGKLDGETEVSHKKDPLYIREVRDMRVGLGQCAH